MNAPPAQPPGPPPDLLSGDALTGLPTPLRQALEGIVKRHHDLTRELAAAREQIERLERTSLEDPLLPMLSTKAFLHEGNRTLLYRARHQLATTFFYLNVDRFRSINERFGQSAGDAVLMSISNDVVRMLRASDLFGRIGADEFGVMLMHSDARSVHSKCERLVGHVRDNPVDYLGSPIAVTVTSSLLDCGGFETPQSVIEAARRDVKGKRARNSPRDADHGLE
ncbi:MAG TPA: GGDEF domain-containing protein [Candidatus Sulfotelmatobacter sp.]|nr:GGDEF domain-containing protein [Candidatus Sulfotelmatobacter sp.]